jgi:hypothetical protein
VKRSKERYGYCIKVTCSFAYWDRALKRVAVCGEASARSCRPHGPETDPESVLGECLDGLAKRIVRYSPFR